MSPTQATYLTAFVSEYLTALRAQVARWGDARADFGLPASTQLRTRDALINAGYLEITSRGASWTIAAPTRKAIEWWMGPRAGFIAARDAR